MPTEQIETHSTLIQVVTLEFYLNRANSTLIGQF